MNIPKTLKINGFDWSVKLDGAVAVEGSVFGSCHYKTQTLYLDPDTTKQKQEQCLLHEIMHAIAWQSGLGKRLDLLKINGLEEEIITCLSFGLHQVLKDNNLLRDTE